MAPDETEPERSGDREQAIVSATFDEKHDAARAVESLTARGIATDEIDVVLMDEEGFHTRDVELRTRFGLVRGLAIGVVVGALVGGFVAVLLATLAEPSAAYAVGTLAGVALRGLLAGAAAGIPLGAVFGLSRWKGSVRIEPREGSAGSVLVSVTSRGRAAIARSVLSDSGAAHVSG